MPLIRKTISSPPPSKAGPAALTALATGNDDERWAAARAAGEMQGGIQALAAALVYEANPRVREAMFTGLARNPTAESVELTLPLLRSDNAAIRTGALDTLRAMKDVVWPYVPLLLVDQDPDIRLLACELTRGMPQYEASHLLCELLDSESEVNVCASAVEVLADVGGPEVLSALARCGERFRATSFLTFSIKAAADRIGSFSSGKRG